MQTHTRFARTALTLVVSIAASAACASRQVDVVNTDAAAAAAAAATPAMAMTATLSPMSGAAVTGTATATHGDAATNFRSSVSISGASASATHPWHVHSGRCGDNGPIIGPASAYPPLQVGPNGAATANATVPVAMPSGPLYVNVHLSPTQMGTIVACGNLQ